MRGAFFRREDDEDVARAYVYLIDSELTTGITLKIDGGHALI